MDAEIIAKKNSPVYVRAQNGALYRNPTFMVAGGIVTFPLYLQINLDVDDVIAEAVQWIPENGQARLIREILDDAFGKCRWVRPWIINANVEAEIPSSGDPPRKSPAAIWAVTVTRAIPEPTIHEGFERYKGRCRPGQILELPE